MSETHAFFITVANGLESLLESELHSLGLTDTRAVGAGVYLNGRLSDAYRVCLWSRLANRVLLPIADFPAAGPEALYDGIRSIDWSQHMAVSDTLAVDFFSASSAITHTQFGALKVKDAVVDQFREACGERPSVERHTPSLRINVYVFRDKARVAVDLAGQGLHRRGYRDEQSRAPLKENLAAALLLAVDWPARAARGESFCDPMCGSGTLLIEAALMAADGAPQLGRDYFGFSGWKGHDSAAWRALLSDAQQRFSAGLARMQSQIRGSDKSARAVSMAQANIARAGLGDVIRVSAQPVEDIRYPASLPRGLVMSNPPYGVRLEQGGSLGPLYATYTKALREHFGGWDAAVFTGAPDLLFRLRTPLKTTLKVANGGIDCKLLEAHLPERRTKPAAEKSASGPAAADKSTGLPDPWARKSAPKTTLSLPEQKPGVDVSAFVNRLKKNLKPLNKWARAEDIGVFRIYDADLPEFALAVDVYDAGRRFVLVQEYRAPASVDPALAEARLTAALAAIPAVTGCAAEDVRLKQRRRQSGSSQYQKLARDKDTHVISEHGCRFEVNLTDYLDTGIFADHRKVRQWVFREAAGRRFLNLFAYTGTATVHAAAGGAASSLTVDMSATYLEWAQRNLALNGLDGPQHGFLRADVLGWLESPPEDLEKFDLILLDPPTFSNSERMEKTWDVQRDHVGVIHQAMRLLNPGGLLIFSNNFRKFRLDEKRLVAFRIENRSRDSIPRDFARNQRIHQCYFIRRP
ncbi:bifunctional 23S rRNA (guanine(2069)-N(7))-methyltransferase RlmK/23S rRNA (guanine(2445)-N(2))-methyltransferase RlmL [Granulosicoccaceae sp. 1_MG-2023]|nr:bifunctional 23S rRNA (guanine(2069)-N(7))-methyltransferase RlmK/23S rRNA (guanine(2445)-N(2))-methyltransferase RlmL [Granulosicoccaceae sp. 1_MG-2023]